MNVIIQMLFSVKEISTYFLTIYKLDQELKAKSKRLKMIDSFAELAGEVAKLQVAQSINPKMI